MSERSELLRRAFQYYLSKLDSIKNDEEIEKNSFLEQDLDELKNDVKHVLERLQTPIPNLNELLYPLVCNVLGFYSKSLTEIKKKLDEKYGVKELEKLDYELKQVEKAKTAFCRKHDDELLE